MFMTVEHASSADCQTVSSFSDLESSTYGLPMNHRVNNRFLPGLYYGLEAGDKAELAIQATWINIHGFGVGWYTDTLAKFDDSVTGMQPAQYRTIAPISTDLAFAQLCRHTASKCTLAHIRDASFPPVVEVNNHPFIFGKYAFMHNGSVNNFGLIRFDVMQRIFQLQDTVQTLAIASSVPNANYVFNILGNTDTEHLATLYFAHLDIIKAGLSSAARYRTAMPFGVDSTEALLLALINTITDIHTIQYKYGVGPFTPGPFPPGENFAGNKLNLCITDGGKQMLVCRWRDAENGFPPSLYLSLTAGEKLNRKYFPVVPDPDNSENIGNPDVKIDSVRELIERYEDLPPTQQGRHVIVGSEPCTEFVSDWGLFDQNQCVIVDDDQKLQILNLAKFFRKGRQHEFERYGFSEVIKQINRSDEKAPVLGIGIPDHIPDLPAYKTDAFEVELNLK
ncbi:N-terminal nucleophile aminohydrolase [Lentinula raphanica]|nr:N-terminal nucleophile aminohydrolase [Lentinula raphanica]